MGPASRSCPWVPPSANSSLLNTTGYQFSVATVERQIATACQNPDVQSEPNQVNFACNKATRQILWVFSLVTSGNNPDFASIKTGRQGVVGTCLGGQFSAGRSAWHLQAAVRAPRRQPAGQGPGHNQGFAVAPPGVGQPSPASLAPFAARSPA